MHLYSCSKQIIEKIPSTLPSLHSTLVFLHVCLLVILFMKQPSGETLFKVPLALPWRELFDPPRPQGDALVGGGGKWVRILQ